VGYFTPEKKGHSFLFYFNSARTVLLFLKGIKKARENTPAILHLLPAGQSP
jgi:hypothetical protein